MPRVRLKDIAEKTNMSIYTVSSALSGRGQISQSKREEVRRVAAEMGYQPNIAGRLLHVRENRDMGLLLLGSSDELRRNVGFADFNLRFMQLCKEAGIRHRTEWFSPQEHPKDGTAHGRTGRRSNHRGRTLWRCSAASCRSQHPALRPPGWKRRALRLL